MAGNWEATDRRRLNELNDPLKHKRMEYRRHSVLLCGRVRYDVMIGDIANSQEDVVVNSTGPGISLGPPLAKAIFKKAGPGLTAAAANIVPLAEGDVVETESFNMGCKEIFHCNAAHWNSISQSNEKLKHIVKLCLKKTSAKQHKSIALPAIGMGMKGYPPEVVSKSITEAITEYVENYSNSSLTHIKLYIFPADDTKLLREAFSNLLRIKVKGTKVEDGFKLANDVKLTVYNGNLAQTKADAIVLADGCEMNQSARDSLALIYLAAERIRKECGAEDVVVTESFGLPCSYVLHVICPPWNNESGEQVLEDVVSKCLNKAKDQKLEKVAFPPIGVGAQNYPPEIAAECFLRASSSFAEKNPDCSKNNIILVAHGPAGASNVKAFEEALGVKVKDQPKEEVGPVKTDLSKGKLVVDLPPNWDKPFDEYKEVSLSPHSPEFRSVSGSFKITIGKPDDEVTLLEVVRIQNPKVYSLYNTLIVYVAKTLSKPANDVETSPLWHATQKANIEKIKQNNFDRGLSGAVVIHRFDKVGSFE